MEVVLYFAGAFVALVFFLLFLIRQRKKREAKQHQWKLGRWRWRVGKAKARRFFYFLVLVITTGVAGIFASIHPMLMPAIVIGAVLYLLWRLFQRARRWWARTWARIVHAYGVVRKLWEQIPEKIRVYFLLGVCVIIFLDRLWALGKIVVMRFF